MRFNDRIAVGAAGGFKASVIGREYWRKLPDAPLAWALR